MSVVYVDELFILNTGIDYFLLLGTAKVCSMPLRRLRYALAAAFGGLWCCLALLNCFAWLSGNLMKTVLALAMCLAAFGKDGKLWRSFAVFLGLSVMFGGAVWAAGIGRGIRQDNGRFIRLDMRVLLLSFSFCWAGIELVFRHSVRKAAQPYCNIEIHRGKKSVKLRALRDTGNALYDPLTGKKVLVAEADALAPLFDNDEAAALKTNPTDAIHKLAGFRLIPYAALHSGGLLLCFSPTALCVDGNTRNDVAVAVSINMLSQDGSYRALL